MDQEIKQILKSHGEILESHGEMLKSHGEQLDLIATKVVEHEEQLERITRVVVGHTERLDRIDEKLEQVATKEDISKMTNTLDKIVKLTEKKDEELTLMAYGLRNVEKKVEANTKDIQKMKPLLGLS